MEYKVESEMLLAADLFPSILDETKRVTLRKGKRIFAPELKIINRDQPEQNTVVEVQAVKYCTLATCGLATLYADGFKSTEDAVEQMKRFYPDITATTPITVITFNLKS